MSRLLQLVAGLCFGAALVAMGFGIFGDTDRAQQTAGERALPIAAIPEATAVPPTPTPAPSPTAVPPTPTPEPAIDTADIVDLLTSLTAEADAWSEGADAGIALALENELHTGGVEEQVFSASSTKPVWITAALLAGVRIEEVAEPIMEFSDNELTGLLLAEAGIDTVNAFTSELGLADTRLAGWPFGDDRLRASDFDEAGRVNLTTAADLVEFWRLLADDEIDGVDGPALLELFTITQDANTGDSPYGGAMTDRLPASTAAATAHKAGWFPPDCCETADRLIITAGSIPLDADDRDAQRYSLALWLRNGDSYQDGVAWVGWASCRIHALVTDASLSCSRSEDPVTPDL